jgi:hypothetical protein
VSECGSEGVSWSTTQIPSMMLLRARMNPISDIPLIKLLGMMSEGIAAVCLSGATVCLFGGSIESIESIVTSSSLPRVPLPIRMVLAL